MISAAFTPDEHERVRALVELEIMDTDPEKEFDDIVQLASQICETPMSLITLLDEKRQWFKAKVGLDGTETSRDLAFCSHAILDDKLMVVENALLDERFSDNPFVTSSPDVRFYAGMPLTSKAGYKLGTLCVIDTVPRSLTPLQKHALEVLSNQVIKLLEMRIAQRKMEQQAGALQRLNEANAKLLSIIGHDLRTPLANLQGIISLNAEGGLDTDESIEMINDVGASVDGSLALLDNLMTWATQQFKNEKIYASAVNVREVLGEIAKSLATKTSAKANTVTISTNVPVAKVNENVFRLLVRNLLANANKFTANGHIKIDVKEANGSLAVSISDTGVGMTPEQINNLFDWDTRNLTEGTSGERGLGMGLKLCQEMLQAEGGNLTVDSVVGAGTVFRFVLPLG